METINFYLGKDSEIKNVIATESSKIYNHCRVSDTVLGEKATIGDFSTVRESQIGEHSYVQRHSDIWRMKMGRFTGVGRMSTIQGTEIGSFCALSWNLKIGGDDHDYHMISINPFWHNVNWGIATDKDYSDAYLEKEYEEPCIIGNDCWIAAGVSICRNVKIGNGCIIGAGAVITKDIEPYSVVVGVPGRVIKKRFDDKTIERLENTNWWDLPTNVLRENISIFKDSHLNEQNLEKLEELCAQYNVNTL